MSKMMRMRRKQVRTSASPHCLLRRKSGGLPAVPEARRGLGEALGCRRLPDHVIISTIDLISSKSREGYITGSVSMMIFLGGDML